MLSKPILAKSHRYVALLRGINVGGKNKVAMANLKACLEQAGLDNVSTYINSGNVIFDSQQTQTASLVAICERAIETKFGFRIVCTVISADQLRQTIKHAPTWWGQGEAKHNALFVIAPKRAEDLMREIGSTKPEYEKVAAYHPVIFWSAPVETLSRTRYSKIVGTKAYQSVTIRNSNTFYKLIELIGNV